MRILIIAPGYPSLENEYAYAFVHTRAKVYAQARNNVKVFVPSARQIPLAYVYDGTSVVKAGWMHFLNLVNDFDPDVFAVHAPRGQWEARISRARRPVVSWIHAAEALLQAFHHYYTPFSFRDSILKSMSLFSDPIKCVQLHRFLAMSDAVVYVSNWMKKVAENYTLLRHPMAFVIPNMIDTDLFKYQASDREPAQGNGVSLRTLDWKYGLDVAVRAYSNLKEAHLTIRGKGPLESYLKKLARLCKSSVDFVIQIVPRKDLPSIYNKYGYFVAPSRMDSQGVAMCEAMACGLPTIATQVGGIPEFVKDRYNGLLIPPDEPIVLRKAVRLLVSNGELYTHLSENAANFVQTTLSHNVVYEKERNALEQAQENYGRKRK